MFVKNGGELPTAGLLLLLQNLIDVFIRTFIRGLKVRLFLLATMFIREYLNLGKLSRINLNHFDYEKRNRDMTGKDITEPNERARNRITEPKTNHT